jgi:hypothetical protein
MTEWLGNARTFEHNRQDCAEQARICRNIGDLEGAEHWCAREACWVHRRDEEQERAKLQELNYARRRRGRRW